MEVHGKKIKIPDISRRGKEIQGSPIRKLAFIAEERKKNGIRVYHLNIGQPDLPSPKAVFEAINSFPFKTIEYAPSNGIPRALSAWKKYLSYFDINYNESEMIITTGGSEALIFSMCTVCDHDDEIIVFEPFYTNYNGFASISDVVLRSVPLTIENGFHLPPQDEIEKYITDKTRAILFCNPSNPTGKIFSREELQRLVDISEKFGLFLLSDEVYREFAYESKPISIAQFPSVSDKAILIDSCSKRFNVCGARIGLMACRNKSVISAALKLAQARLSVATIEQLALVPLLEDPEPYTKAISSEFRLRRDTVFEGLRKIPGITYYKPEGAFYMIIGLPIGDSEHFAKWLIEEYDYEGETVLLAPAQGFYATHGKGMNEVRLAFMLKAEDLERSLVILKNGLEAYKKKYK
jgi:aspartate aminotransferase